MKELTVHLIINILSVAYECDVGRVVYVYFVFLNALKGVRILMREK